MEKKTSHSAPCEVHGACSGVFHGRSGLNISFNSLGGAKGAVSSCARWAVDVNIPSLSTAAVPYHGNFLCPVLPGHLRVDLQPYFPILG